MLDLTISPYPDEMTITASQCRAARGAVGMEVKALAHAANVSTRTIIRFESGKSTPHRALMIAIEKVLTKAGVTFIGPDENGKAGIEWSDR